MIIYDLRCESKHEFEGWFKDMASFEIQRKAGHIECPVCGSASVEIIPSSNRIKGRRTESETKAEESLSAPMALKMIHDFIDKHFDNVGDRFAEVALKMHRGEEPKRNIKGYTTTEQQELLEEKGIEFFRIPPPPKLDS